MDAEPRTIITEQMLEACRLKCTPALMAVANACELIAGGESIDARSTGQKLGECLLGSEVVGICGTKKTRCRHPAVAGINNTDEQIGALTNYIVEFATD